MSENHTQGPSPDDVIASFTVDCDDTTTNSDNAVDAVQEALQYTEQPAQMMLPGMDDLFFTHVDVVTGPVEEARMEVAADPLTAPVAEAAEAVPSELEVAEEEMAESAEADAVVEPPAPVIERARMAPISLMDSDLYKNAKVGEPIESAAEVVQHESVASDPEPAADPIVEPRTPEIEQARMVPISLMDSDLVKNAKVDEPVAAEAPKPAAEPKAPVAEEELPPVSESFKVPEPYVAESILPSVPVKPVLAESAAVDAVREEPVPAPPEPKVVPVEEPVVQKVEVASEPVVESVPQAVEPTAELTDSTESAVDPTPEVVVEPEEVVEAENGFLAIPLSDEVQAAVAKQGYGQPTEIQAEIIPFMLDGRDVLAQSQTGTGKTAAFALPILSKIEIGPKKPQVLVLAPTRELAMQVGASFAQYGSEMRGLNIATIYGGADYSQQFRQLKRGVEIVVGTPGRVIDHIKRGTLDLSGLKCLVLDEADEMLNMGFLEDVQFVLEQAPEQRQVALFSATLPAPIRGIAQHYLNDPARITIKTKTMTAESIRQRAIFTVGREKINVLKRILEVEETDGIIVFTKTKESTVTVAEQLNHEGFSAVALNGDMPQKTRERTITQLKKGRLNILVATDVAARGLDVERISHVFNYDLPHGTESYIHRIGRTGRAGRKGEAIIFLTRSQRGRLRSIEHVTKQPIEVIEAPTADEINAIRVKRYKDKISKTAEELDCSFFQEMLAEHSKETGLSMDVIAAAVARMAQGRRPFFLKKDKPKPKFDRNERSDRQGGRDNNRRERVVGPPEAGKKRYRIAIGWKDGVKPGNIVGAVANEGGIDGKAIGHINIQQSYTTIDLPDDMPREIEQQLYHTRVVGRQMRLTVATDADSGTQSKGSHGGGSRKPRGPRKFNGSGKKFGYSKAKKRKDK